jgi:FXSXX-COOH protein
MIDSNSIDLDNFDLSTLTELPNSLRAAIERVRAELAGDGEQAAFFESSLPSDRKAEGR